MKKAVIAIAVISIIFGGIFFWNYKTPEERMAQQERNLDSAMVRIQLAGKDFNIPVRYMYGETQEKYYQWPAAKSGRVKVDYISLSVMMPDLRPYYKEEDKKWKKLGRGDRVDIMISEVKKNNVKDWFVSSLGRARSMKNPETGIAFLKPGNDIPGLIHFSGKHDDVYYTNYGDNIIITCFKIGYSPHPSCQSKSSYMRDFVLDYSYGVPYFSEWQKIDDGLKSMFNGFARAAQLEIKGRE